MTTRFTANSSGLRSGYDNANVSTDVTIPACGVEDVDVAVFSLFNEEIPLQVSAKEGLKRAKVIFAAGEKWAVIKKKKDIRDRQGRLILPLVTVGRTNIVQDPVQDITGRGINQQTGELRVLRRLSKNDRTYQNLINRLFIKNQMNLAVNPDQGVSPLPGQLTTTRTVGDLAANPDIVDGAYLAPVRNDNVWETITIPAPQFFTANYEVTFWTQYTAHMTEMVQMFIAAQLPQGNAFRISNPANDGYWFVANVEGNEYNPENNFDNMFEQERVIKYTFNLRVPAYVLATDTPGAPIPVRRNLSATSIEFESAIGDVTKSDATGDDDPWFGADDPTLPYDTDTPERLLGIDKRRTGHPRLGIRTNVHPDDPALRSYPRGTTPAKYLKVRVVGQDGNVGIRNVRITSTNPHTGESTFSARDLTLGGFSLVVVDE